MRKEKIKDFYKPNSYYHIYNRGNDKQKIYRCDRDYKVFVNLLFKYIKETRLVLISYCLMPNHFHLVVKNGLKRKEVSIFMQKFMTAYVMYFNRKYKKVGRLFQGPFNVKRLSRTSDLPNIITYLKNNPFEAGLVDSEIKESYKWLYVKKMNRL